MKWKKRQISRALLAAAQKHCPGGWEVMTVGCSGSKWMAVLQTSAPLEPLFWSVAIPESRFDTLSLITLEALVASECAAMLTEWQKGDAAASVLAP